MESIAIIGLGLIGGSLAGALKAANAGITVYGFDAKPESIITARDKSWIDMACTSAGEAAKHASLVVLAVPPGILERVMREISGHLQPDSVVTDTASVKRVMAEAAARTLPIKSHVIPCHPIAGTAGSGIEAATPSLFAGKRIILTPTEAQLLSEPVARVRALWKLAGGKVDFMPDTLHDRIYATMSHLPQLIAFAARDALATLPPGPFTRLWQSPSALWRDIFFYNRDYIRETLADMMAFLAQIAGELTEGHTEHAANDNAELPDDVLPALVASCLIGVAAQREEETGIPLRLYAGSGFADMTKPARGDAETMLSSISTHAFATAEKLRTLLQRLALYDSALREDNPQKLSALLS